MAKCTLKFIADTFELQLLALHTVRLNDDYILTLDKHHSLLHIYRVLEFYVCCYSFKALE